MSGGSPDFWTINSRNPSTKTSPCTRESERQSANLHQQSLTDPTNRKTNLLPPPKQHMTKTLPETNKTNKSMDTSSNKEKQQMNLMLLLRVTILVLASSTGWLEFQYLLVEFALLVILSVSAWLVLLSPRSPGFVASARVVSVVRGHWHDLHYHVPPELVVEPRWVEA